MRTQVILDSPFAHPGSAAIGGGKKGEFRDWTKWEANFRPEKFKNAAITGCFGVDTVWGKLGQRSHMIIVTT